MVSASTQALEGTVKGKGRKQKRALSEKSDKVDVIMENVMRMQ